MNGRPLRRATVLGAGVMGSQIAALLAGAGVEVRLLDLERGLVEAGLQRLTRLKPAPLYTPDDLRLISPGTFADGPGDADWVIEAVVENLEAKRRLWSEAAAAAPAGALLSTNTSGLPVSAIAAALPASARPRFLGTHFFNPPRYLRLVELVAVAETSPAALERAQAFVAGRLGKGTVMARDTPNFIGNRLAVYGLNTTLAAMAEAGLGVEEVDLLTGPALGRPRSATFRTLDLVGLDTYALVLRTGRERAPSEEERQALAEPAVISELIRRGWLGEKSGQGFYRARGREVLDLATLEYRPRRRPRLASVERALATADPAERLRLMLAAEPFARSVWERCLTFAAAVLPEIAASPVEVDRAMRWGFGWELGPFEGWDAVGLPPHPAWAEGGPFYREGSVRTPQGPWVVVPRDARHIKLAELPRIEGNAGTTLYDLGDGVACLALHGPKDALGVDAVRGLQGALERVEAGYRGLVLTGRGDRFSVGANLAQLLLEIEEGNWDAVEAVVRAFQAVGLALRYAGRPVVAAPAGYALGGGCELCLASARVVAAAETYVGLVEVGAGLIPAGGGCKELLRRVGLQRAFELIGTARVALGAPQAVQLGILTPADLVVREPDLRLWEAKRTALYLDETGYAPPAPPRLAAAGAEGRAALEVAAHQELWARRIDEHQLTLARRLARVLTGGDRPAGSPLAEQDLLDLEREAFLSLAGEAETQRRMRAVLKGG